MSARSCVSLAFNPELTFPHGVRDRPRVLNLPSADEITAMEHVDILRLNGFDVYVDEDAGVGERVKLTAQPVSKDTVFDVGGQSPELAAVTHGVSDR